MTNLSDNRSKMPLPDKGMSVTQLLKSTPLYVRNKARQGVVIKGLTPTWTKAGFKAIQCVSQDLTNSTPETHTVTLIGIDTKYEKGVTRKNQITPLSKQKRVLVDCDCGFHTFYCEYALWTHGASRIRRSNGQPAVVTNPGNIPMLCKHLFQALKTIKEKGM